ncbi:hypothetical protein SDC9_212835 [bioreactor metagenome]|uniref:Uncharacterized protein n=1 Tax=bioreactor metagenome TaxID=1076179 RepID=A0A645JNV5_9ZZZZ
MTNGPSPTRVVYAFRQPTTSLILFGAIPEPEHMPPPTVEEDVTKGYVPWSTSSMEPWAPSKSTFLPLSIRSFMRTDVSHTYLPKLSFHVSNIWHILSTVHPQRSLPYMSRSSFFIGRRTPAFSLMRSGSRRSPALKPHLAILS